MQFHHIPIIVEKLRQFRVGNLMWQVPDEELVTVTVPYHPLRFHITCFTNLTDWQSPPIRRDSYPFLLTLLNSRRLLWWKLRIRFRFWMDCEGGTLTTWEGVSIPLKGRFLLSWLFKKMSSKFSCVGVKFAGTRNVLFCTSSEATSPTAGSGCWTQVLSLAPSLVLALVPQEGFPNAPPNHCWQSDHRKFPNHQAWPQMSDVFLQVLLFLLQIPP